MKLNEMKKNIDTKLSTKVKTKINQEKSLKIGCGSVFFFAQF
jgi:hypothetical protein